MDGDTTPLLNNEKSAGQNGQLSSDDLLNPTSSGDLDILNQSIPEAVENNYLPDTRQFCYIDDGEGCLLQCVGYRRIICKCIVFHLLGILSAGFLYLLSHWSPRLYLFFTHERSCFKKSTKVLLKDGDDRYFVEDIEVLHELDDTILSKIFNKIDIEAAGSKYDSEAINVSESMRKRVPEQKLPETGFTPTRNTHTTGLTSLLYFVHEELKYVYDNGSSKFELLKGYDGTVTLLALHKHSRGLSREEESKSLLVYGNNTIDVHVKSYARLFFEESADPFYIFQVFSCILWLNDEYYYYAAAILFISVVSICISIYQAKSHLLRIRNMVAHSDKVTVLRPTGAEELLSSEDLTIGDVIAIPQQGCLMYCDAILISGTAIVNESSLTGESVPVTKVAIPASVNSHVLEKEILDPKKHKRNILFCGSNVLQTRYFGDGKVLAVVCNTGFLTLKGKLIRSILHPKPLDFKFFIDALKFVFVLAVMAFIGLSYSAYIFYRDGARIHEIILRALDIVTIAVPPALPAAMSVGVVYALQRLQKEKIFCISPSRINIAGKVKLFCFDKTGTLTEDGLDFFGVTEVENSEFKPIKEDIETVNPSSLVIGMATCHSITHIDGKLCGNPLDLKMFEATGWELEETGKETELFETVAPTIVRPGGRSETITLESLLSPMPPIEVAILKQFPFSSDLQRMSVLIRALGEDHMDVYVKGSPEMIASLCIRETIPSDFEEELKRYTSRGYRVIGVACKSLSKRTHWHQAQHLTRHQIECDLSFLGLVVLKNTLKPETWPVIRELYKADIRVVMITGDNLLTAVSVSRECGIISVGQEVVWVNAPEGSPNYSDIHYTVLGHFEYYPHLRSATPFQHFLNQNYHFAMTGRVFTVLRNSPLYERFLLCTTIYARMLPDQKAQLVEDLQRLGYGVGMCGDGANDCGALKSAHCGISLSEAEASVASPFTSKIPNISCVVNVIKEGRCALVTSFSVFKYMALYSMTQFSTILLLYYIESNLGNFQYLYIDLFLILPIAITMSRTGPFERLVKQRPLGSLIHPLVLMSLILQTFMQLVIQVGMWFFVQSLSFYKDANWFRRHRSKPSDGVTQVMCYENTALFCITCFQYIVLAIAFATGKPYRKPFYTNFWMVLTIFILLALTVVFTYFNGYFLPAVFEMVKINDISFFCTIIELAAINAVLSMVLETLILSSSWLKNLVAKIRNKKTPKNRYKIIRKSMENDTSWPPHVKIGQ